ncbi:TonB-dependent receptor [Luteimonas sp. YGD11-2]|uniref:TonB-dependent receptor plug domain-containing protein n=1 Tax=Luteimonas sp. YGD11-2 TaxID=2508168 RepID=UPI00100C3348|nr:TonB-dependent receptor [Luteimonas sp. YGD11-2]
MKARIPAMRPGLLPAAILTALLPVAASAQAQDAADGATTLDRISVTGSRIRGVEIENQQPILTVSRQDIERSGHTSVADLLQNIPSAGSPAISRADALASGENVGGYYIDIRNLGANRTLVLLNGVRLGATTGGYQDLSQIPMAAIERIDVLKDGASSIYGSDAIAAVVNVITRKRFEGAEASIQYGQYGQGDGAETTYSATVGVANDRSGITVSAEVMEADPVYGGDRFFSRYGNAGPDYPGSGWSPVSQYGSWQRGSEWVTLRPGGDPSNAADFVPLTPEQYANSNEQMLVSTGMKRESVFSNINYDLTDRITLNADLLFNKRTTDQMIAGYPYQSESRAINTPLSADSAFNPTGEQIQFRRRLWEVPRTTTSQLKTTRFSGGVSGYFDIADRPWDWDVNYAYNRNEVTKTGHGDASLIATRQALGPSYVDANGVARCGVAGAENLGLESCRPWNPLLPYGVAGQGSLGNQDVQDFLFPYYTDTGETKTKILSANLSGSLFELPAGDLSMAVGIEHRKDEGRFVPDAFAQSGQYTGLAASTTLGEYEVDEAYIEFNVPILSDMAFARELTVNVASRYSDYSNFGDTINSKFSVLWRPSDALAVRGTWAEGFRAPSIDNLYGGTGASFEQYTDPCSVGVPGSVNGNAACNAAGVPVGYVQLGQGYQACTSWPCQTPDQFISGSNPNLGPETSESVTAGIVYSPEFADGLDLSLDWYRYELENIIISDSVNRILRDCYVIGDSSRCAGITRAGDGHISAMFYGLTNLGSMETEGWDFGVKYRLRDTAFGGFNFNWQTTYTSKYDQAGQNADGEDIMIGYVGDPGIFRVKSNLNVNWEVNDEWNIGWTTRYYSGINDGCVANRPCSDPDRYAYGETAPRNQLGSNTFHDFQVAYTAPWNATISVGVDNVFEREAQIMYSGGNVSTAFPYYPEFDIGRFTYMRYVQRF